MTVISPIHDFVEKLTQRAVAGDVNRYLESISSKPAALEAFFGAMPISQAPLSINFDLTVACNHACPHCIDEAILNSRAKFPFAEVVVTLITLRMLGLRSVIFIGGGEPTLYPDFARVVQVAAALGLRIGIVSNGSRSSRLIEAARHLSSGDWIRLSLDAGSDEVFQRTHRPRTPSSLYTLCEGPLAIKKINPHVSCGFSFVIIAPEMSRYDARLTVNYHEIGLAARVAKTFGFDYISFKPFLVRDSEGKEVLPFALASGTIPSNRTFNEQYISVNELLPGQKNKNARLFTDRQCKTGYAEGLATDSLSRIRQGLEEAGKEADEHFRVIPSLNLLAMFQPELLDAIRNQPRRCHMQALRQVITPTGIYGCPAYRGNERSLISARDGYSTAFKSRETACRTSAQIEKFDASAECRNIACMYNRTNWWLEQLSADGCAVPSVVAEDDEIPVFL